MQEEIEKNIEQDGEIIERQEATPEKEAEKEAEKKVEDDNQDDKRGKGWVPADKYQDTKHKMRELERKLEEIAEAEQARKIKELEEKNDFKALLKEKEKMLNEVTEKAKAKEDKIKTAMLTNAVVSLAVKYKAIDPTDIVNYIKDDMIDIDIEDGQYTFNGVEDVIKSLVETKPYLFGEVATGQPSANTAQKKPEIEANESPIIKSGSILDQIADSFNK